MTQTHEPEAGVPTLQWGTFIADLKDTPEAGVTTWITQFKELLWQTGHYATVNRVLIGRTGRVVLELLAVEPDVAVAKARALADGEGPEVLPL